MSTPTTLTRPTTAMSPRPRVHGARTAAVQYAACVAVVWLVSLAGAAIWLNGRGLHTLGGSFPRLLQDVGSLAGIVASVLLLFQVLFMSRFPLFEKGLGRDVIVAMHKKVGFWSFWAIVAHATLLAVGYNLAVDDNPWTALGVFTWQLRGAIVGTVIVFAAAILLSIRKLKAKLSYDAWHWWHMAAYVGAFLTVPHQIALGGSFIQSRVATVFWIGLWGATFVAVAVWRVGVPIRNFLRHDMRIVEVRPDGARGVDVVVSGRNLDRLGTKAGQFFTWRFLGSPGGLRANPFSISMPPTDDRLRICVRVVGDGTRRIAGLRPGQRVFAEGPYGRISGDLRTGTRMLMFAAGAGAGPMVALLTDQEWAPGEATLVSRENVLEDAMMVEDIERLVEERGLIWKRVTGQPAPHGSRWLPPTDDGGSFDGAALIREWVEDDVENVDVFLCGPPIWMTGVQVDVAKAGVPDHLVHVESFQF